MPQFVSTPEAVPPFPVFSQATISGGRVYCSGSIGCSKEYVVVAGGVKAETARLPLTHCHVQPGLTCGRMQRAALENMAAVLRAAGSGLEHIVKANVYLTDMKRDFAAMNEVYLEFFEKDRMPARTCVGVACLPLGACMEIECVAEVP